jgi:hypothetical protein
MFTKYHPDGLLIAHHDVGSDDWSADGFARYKQWSSLRGDCSECFVLLEACKLTEPNRGFDQSLRR